MIKGLYDFAAKWAEKGSVWIISDTHFDDADCKLMDPDWISPDEQVTILKKYIHKNDTLIHLGDVGDPKYLDSIPGYKVLLLGNHDFTATKFRPYFNEIYEGPLIIGRKLILSHEPVDVPWAYNIHGHNHSGWNIYEDGLVFPRHHLNVAANVYGYTPESLGRLIKIGILSKTDDIHRITIDNASENGLRTTDG